MFLRDEIVIFLSCSILVRFISKIMLRSSTKLSGGPHFNSLEGFAQDYHYLLQC